MNDNKVELDDDLLDKIKGGDGTLPGGMPPEMLQNLSEFFYFVFTLLELEK
jgi:hypothetical protein